jgi:signal transduction histidine kinase/putative methionine-R-sulfoxide reductase with GAF domain
MHPHLPSIRGFFRLDELLTPDDLQQYSKGPVGLTFLNLGLEEIWQDARAPELCDVVSRVVLGERDCHACTIVAKPPSTSEPMEAVCVAGVHKTLAAVTVQGRPIGYVSGPQYPSAALYDRDLTGLPAEMRDWLEKYRRAPGVDRRVILDAVGSIARRLGRRCILERRLRIIRDVRTRFVAAKDPDEVLDLTCRALEALFGEVDICFYVLEETGFLKLISARGPSEDAMPASLSPEIGHVGRVIKERMPYYESDVEGDSEFIHTRTTNRVHSAFTVPLPWGADEAPGALQAASKNRDHFALADRQAMQSVVEMAGLAVVKLFLKAKSVSSTRYTAAETWATIGLALTAAPKDRPVEILAARSRLYKAMVEEALRVSFARAACVGIRDRHDTVRVAAVAGEGWTEEAKDALGRSDIRNAVMYALDFQSPFDVPDTARESRFRTILDFTFSMYIVPFRLKGEAVGVLALSSGERNGFTREAKDAVKHLIDQFEELLAALETREDALFKRFASGSDIQTLTRDSVEVIRRAFRVRSCSLFLKSRDADRVELYATTGPMPEEGVQAYEYGEGLTGWVALERRSVRLRDTDDIRELDAIAPGLRPEVSQKWREEIADGDVNHVFLAVPLVAHDRLIGVIRLKVKEDLSEFTHEEETSLIDVAGRLATTVDEVWIAEETAERVRQLEKEAALQRQITEAETLEGTCQILAEEFRRQTGAVASEIIIIDNTPGYEARLTVRDGLLKGLTSDNQRIADGALGILPRRTNPQYDDHVATRSEWRPVIAPVERRFRDSPMATIVSAATLPFSLDSQDRMFGVLLLCWNTPQNFDEHGGRHLDDLIRRAITTLRPSTLRRHIDIDLDHRVHELDRLRMIGLGFAQMHDLDLLMHTILDVSLDESKMERASIRFLNDTTSTLDLKLAIPDDRAPHTVPVTRFFQQSLDSMKCVFVPDALKDELWREAHRDGVSTSMDAGSEKIRSVLHVPIRLHDKCIGLIILDSEQVHDIEPLVLEFLEILGLYAAVAIDFARMRQESSEAIKLAQPLAMMGQMLQGFLHEIRNRVNDLFAILGNIADTSISTYMQEKTREMRQQLSSLRRIGDDLALFTRADPVSVAERMPLNDLIERTLGEFGPRLRERDIAIERVACDPSPVLIGNTIQIEIAFKMLIQNAIEAMEKGGRLAVESAFGVSGARVSFRDTGVGMDQATRMQCMQPFFTTKRDSGGTGLGLSVVFGIMTRHRGRVEVASEPGAGSTFTLFFTMYEESTRC